MLFPSFSVIGVFLLVAFAVHAVFAELDKRNARRAVVGAAAAKAASFGLVKTAALGMAYSQGNYPEFCHELSSFVRSFTSDPNFLATELKGALAHLAGTPDGLKLLQDAVAVKATA